MKRLILLTLLLPAIAVGDTGDTFVFTEPARFWSFYHLYAYHPEARSDIRLCDQPGLEQYSYLDDSCYREVPQPFGLPYEHVWVEPFTNTERVVRENNDTVDKFYRECIAQLPAPNARTAKADEVKKAKAPKKAKKKKSSKK